MGRRYSIRRPLRLFPPPARTRAVPRWPVSCSLFALSMASLSAGCRAPADSQRGSPGVRFENLHGYIEFVARARERDQKSKITPSANHRAKETLMEENLRLETEGYIYHPNFIEFTLGGLFGLLQNEYEQTNGDRETSSRDDGTVLEFDLQADFFKKKKYPGSIFGRRNIELEPRPFQPSLEVTTTTYGFNWQYVDEKMPIFIQFHDTEVKLNPVDDSEEDGYQRTIEFRAETTYRFSDTNQLTLRYSYRSVEEQPFELDYDINELTLSHRLHFGPNRLDSELVYFQQKGTFNIDRLRWRESLRLEHNDDLRSWYVVEMLDRKQGTLSGVEPIDERSISLAATLEHELYDSLVTQLTIFGQKQTFGSGLDIDRLGFTATFDYRKENRWGMLLAAYQFRHRTEKRSGGTQRSEVLDERHSFADPEPIVLSSTNVDAGTIRIKDEERTTLYRPGRDYTIRVVGDRTEIRRSPTGLIADLQLVLVDYVFVLGGDFDLDTTSHRFTIRQDFDCGFAPYFRYIWQDQEVDPPGAAGVTPEDIRSQLFGMEYVRGRLRLQAEYEDHDSTISPFKALRLTAAYTHRFKFGGVGTLRGRWTDISYEAPNDRDTKFFSVEGRYRHAVTRNLTVEGAVLYRDQNDSLNGSDRGVEADLSLEWLIRETEMRLTYEYGEYSDRFSDNEFSSLWIRVRRNF